MYDYRDEELEREGEDRQRQRLAAQKLERSMKLREKMIADRSADPRSQAEQNGRQLRREPTERYPTIEEEPTTPFQKMFRESVRPHAREKSQDAFRMELDVFHDHPGVPGFLVNVALYETALRMQVRPYYGSNPLLFDFDDFPNNTWVQVQDNQGNMLPLAVYVDGAMGVYGKWLYPQRPPA